MKTGKLPAVDRPKDFLFTKYRAAAANIVVPDVFGHGDAFTDWGVLGNDNYGDCVWAGADHEHMLLNQLASGSPKNFSPVQFSAVTALADYSAITGFNQADPNTDNGTDMGAALEYRRKTGIVDVNGKRHFIGAYVRLEPGNIAHLLEALYLFEIVGLGFKFPKFAMDQFNQGKPWDVGGGDATLDGGHYVMVAGRPARGWIDTVSWGRTQRMSEAFVLQYCDEVYGIISEEGLRARTATNFAGFNWQQLGQDAGLVGVLSNPLPPGPAPVVVVPPLPKPVPAPFVPKPLPPCLATRLAVRKVTRKFKK